MTGESVTRQHWMVACRITVGVEEEKERKIRAVDQMVDMDGHER